MRWEPFRAATVDGAGEIGSFEFDSGAHPCRVVRAGEGERREEVGDMSALRIDQRSCFIARSNTYPLTHALAARSG